MPNLSSELHNHVIELMLASGRLTADEWRSWLNNGISPEVMTSLTWSGSPRDFASRLTTQLSFGDLITTLKRLRPDLGIDGEERINQLCQRIQTENDVLIEPENPYNQRLRAYYARCQQQWQTEPHITGQRFVRLAISPDKNETADAPAQMSARHPQEIDDLRQLLKEKEKVILLLGAPGGGKTSLARRLQWDLACAALDSPQDKPTRLIPFYAQLNLYSAEDSDPATWLARQWSAFCADMPPLNELTQHGRMLFLLDGLNEMRCAAEGDLEKKIEQWQLYLASIAPNGNRAVFTCRERDNAGDLGSEAAPLLLARVQPMSEELIQKFLECYAPGQAARAFSQITADAKLLDLYSTPYFLALLISQIDESGNLPPTRARLFTGFVRHALRDELNRRTHLIANDPDLLSPSDKTSLRNKSYPDPFWLPQQGELITRLSHLAFAMQEKYRTEGSQVAFLPDEAAGALGAHASHIVTAGRHIKMLDEVSGSGKIKFFHQLLQEYFAARKLAQLPERAAQLAGAKWRRAELNQPYEDWLAGPGKTPGAHLPQLEATGWEETARMAAEMTPNPPDFARQLMPANLPLAGECAAVLDDSPQNAQLKADLRLALVARTQDTQADLRARIAAGLALGALGDPRYTRRRATGGAVFLTPPMARIPGGVYPIGEAEQTNNPARRVKIEPFEMAVFPVTNVEYACFMADGGYANPDWWNTPAAQDWRNGQTMPPEQLEYYLAVYRDASKAEPEHIRAQYAADTEFAETLISIAKNMSEEDFIDLIKVGLGDGQPVVKPLLLENPAFNAPSQPVVGVCWHEARAYALWLSAQTGQDFRLPGELEWEAAARGKRGQAYAYEGAFDPAKANTLESSIRATTPVGVYPPSPEGVYDLTGNVWEWTSAEYAPDALPGTQLFGLRVLRGGSWDDDRDGARAAYRVFYHPANRNSGIGFRLARFAPVP